MMKIAIAGASGFIGRELSDYLINYPCEVVKITRNDLISYLVLKEKISGCHAVINLAGSPIIQRWTSKNRLEIRNSRVGVTSSIADAIHSSIQPPKVFVNISAVGLYYKNGCHDERSIHVSDGFLYDVIKSWENAALKGESENTKVFILRLGVVLGKNGGIIKKLLPIFNLGLGGTTGRSDRPFPFIHIDDLTTIIHHCIHNELPPGIYNVVAPEIATNREFSFALAAALHRPAWFPIPEMILRLLFGKGATVITEAPCVIPQKLTTNGFNFKYRRIDKAVQNIVGTQNQKV